MNVIALILSRDHGAMRALLESATAGVVTYAATATQMAEGPQSLQEFFRAIDRNREFANAFQSAVLPILPMRKWANALATAQRSSVHRGRDEWVACVQYEPLGLGLTLPQDNSQRRRLAFFAGPRSSERVALELRPGLGPRLVTGDSRHCGLPSRARCDAGVCGDCTLAMRLTSPPGLICTCRHEW